MESGPIRAGHQQRGKRLLQATRQALTLVSLSCLFGLLANCFNPHRVPLAVHYVMPGAAQIRLTEAYQLAELKSFQILFVDVRPAEEFRQGAVPGALNHPNSTQPTAELIEQVGSARHVAIYGLEDNDQVAAELAFRLREQGFRQAVTMGSGWSGWKAAGYPVATRL